MSFISMLNMILVRFSKKYNERFYDHRYTTLNEWVYYKIKIQRQREDSLYMPIFSKHTKYKKSSPKTKTSYAGE